MLQTKTLRIFIRFFLIGSIFIGFFSSCSAPESDPERKTIESLGTIINITLYDHINDETFENAFDLVREVHQLMSLEVETSDLVRLNENAGIAPVEISPMTYEVLEMALEIASASNNSFNPAIQPLVALWDITGPNARVPSQEELDAVLPLLDPANIELYPADDGNPNPRAFLTIAGMGVDLGGIAKGFSADLVSDYLKSVGVKRAILDFGGNIQTIGRKTKEKPWIIGLQRPDLLRGTYLGTVPADDESVVTSGVYERFFMQDGVRYHHLLSSETGYPVRNGLEGVVIVADVSMVADGYSTAIFGLGVEDGLALAEETDGLDAIFLTEDKTVYASSGIIDDFVLIDPEYVKSWGD